MGEKRVKLAKLVPRKRRRTLARRVRREIRSLRRWSTLFVVLWGYFKLNEKPKPPRFPPGPTSPSS